MIVFAEDGQGTVSSSDYDFTTTSAAVPSIPLSIEDEDETGEQEEREDEEDEESPVRVAFVKPSFTYAAYQLNGFYNFYEKSRTLSDGISNVTTDLNMLTVIVPDETYTHYRDDPFDTPRIPSQQQYYVTLRNF